MVGPKAVAQAAQLCVFDTRRGQREGDEADKILFFFPDYTAINEQLSVVGLSEGLIAFTRIFSPHALCEAMDAEKHRHLFFECEPDIWMILVVEKGGQAGLEETLRDEALHGVLREAHSLFRLFYGPISTLLSADAPSSDAAKRCLAAFLPDYLSGGVAGKRWRVPTLAESLTERGTVQQLPVERQTLLVIQAIVGFLQTSCGEASGLECVVLFHNLLVSSTLAPEDTAVLCSYAGLRLLPSLLSPSSVHRPLLLPHSSSPPIFSMDGSCSRPTTSSHGSGPPLAGSPARPPSFGRSKLRSFFQNASSKGPVSTPAGNPTGQTVPASPMSLQSAPASQTSGAPRPSPESVPAVSSAAQAQAEAEAPSAREPGSSPATASSACSSRPNLWGNPPRPLKSDTWHRSQEGFLISTAWGAEEGQPVSPAVYLSGGSNGADGADPGGSGWREMALFMHKDLTVVVLLKREGGGAGAAVDLLKKVRGRLEALEQVLAQEWGGPVAAHIQGHRYLCINRATRTVRASPPVKVTTLSKDSLTLLNQVRAEVDTQRRWEAARCAPATAAQSETRHSEQGQECIQNGERAGMAMGHTWEDPLAGEGEVCARGHNGSWVMVRRSLGSELYSAMERASETLLLASEAMEQMNTRHFGGAFPSD